MNFNNLHIVPTTIPYNSNILYSNINHLKRIFPFLKITTIGESILGKDIMCIQIGNGSKQIFYNASTHANEWITSVLLMKFLENLCKCYVSGKYIYGYKAKDILNNVSLFIVPMVNPDGIGFKIIGTFLFS